MARAAVPTRALAIVPARLGSRRLPRKMLLDETGACRAPNDGAYPAECCGGAPLCMSTGGAWHTGGCGNWVCGQEMLCGMISTPGCDCGVGKNFVEGVGCTDDWSCGVQCDYGDRVYNIGDTFTALDGCNTCTCTDQGIPCTEIACNECGVGCQVGWTCNSCPADPECPVCTVCGPPVCEPIVCSKGAVLLAPSDWLVLDYRVALIIAFERQVEDFCILARKENQP